MARSDERGHAAPNAKGRRMSGPFIFIATNRLKPAAYEAERRRVPGLVDFIEGGEPRLLAFNEYIDAARTEVTVVQIHPDAASMEFHMNLVRERAAKAYDETLDATTQIQVFGTPSDAVVETLRVQAGAGVPLSVHVVSSVPRNETTHRFAGLSEAADGTRTHDLLHGKQYVHGHRDARGPRR